MNVVVYIGDVVVVVVVEEVGDPTSNTNGELWG